jgi:hypothetical protein
VTGQGLEQEDLDAVIADAIADPAQTWLTLPSGSAQATDELRALLDDFDAGDRPAAIAASIWLRTEALSSHATSRTRLLIADQGLAGFYSLASAQVELSQRDRGRLGMGPVRVPAALVTWIAKDKRAAIDGKELLLHATAMARRAAELQATSVLVVDPYDEQTAAMWRRRFGFRSSAEARKPKRLWLPLQPVS